MEEEGSGCFSWFIYAIVFYAIFRLIGGAFGEATKYEGQTAEEWFNDYDYCVGQVEEANTRIDDAKYYEGGDFIDMRDALENLEPVESP